MLEGAILRRFYNVAEPMDLTIEEWDELMEARGTIIALEEGDGRQAMQDRKRRMARISDFDGRCR